MLNDILITEELSRTLISNLPGGAAFVVDRDLRYLLAEGEALAIAGFKPEDFVGRTIFEVLPPELAADYEPMYRKALAGEPFEHEHHAHERFYISRGIPLRSANSEVYAVLVVSYDITERRQAEAAAAADLEDTQRLRELSARLVAEDDIQTLYQETVATAIALTRADAGTIQILDEATQELVLLATLGPTPEMIEHFHRVNASSNTSCGMALITGSRTFVDFDVPQSEDSHGSMRMHLEEGYLSAQSTPLITRSGKAIGMVSTHWRKHHRPSDRELRFLDLLARQAADLIEQRQAQVALRESERRLGATQNNAGIGIHELDEMGRYLRMNETFTRFSGYTLADFANRTIFDGIPSEDRDKAREHYGRLVRGEIDSYVEELTYVTRDGCRAWVEVLTTAVRDDEGRFLYAVRAIHDVTQRRNAEVALRESQARLQSIANLVPDLLWDSEPDGSTNWYNQRWMEYTGQTFDEAIGWGWTDAIHPGDRDASARRYREAVEKGVPLHQEHRIRRHDGEYRWFVVNACPLKDENGKVVKMYGAATNIHETRIAMEALHESEAKFRTFVSAASDIIYEMSADWREMRSLKGKEFVTTTENPRRDWTEEYIPETDKPQVWAAIHRAIATRSNFELEHRVIRLDCTVGWTFSRAIPLMNETGEIVKWFGAASDITEQKQAEVALRASEAKYRSLFNSIDEGFCLIEVLFDERGKASDYRFLEANPAFEKHTGLVDAIGKTMRELVPQHEAHWFEIYGRIALTGVPERFENSAQELGRFYDVYAFRMGEPQERKVAILFNDISDRKRREEALRESETRRHLALDAAKMGTFLYYPQEDRGEPDARMLALFGLHEGGTLNLAEAIAKMIHPDDREFYAEAVAKAVNPNGDGKLYAQIRVIHPDESLHWVAVTAQTVFEGEPPQPVRMYGTAADISDRKRREANLAFLAEVSQDLARLTNIEETMNALGAKIGEYFNAPLVAFAEVDKAHGTVTVTHEWMQPGLPDCKGTHLIRDYYTEELRRTCRAGEPYVVRDAASDPRLTTQNLTEISLQSLVSVPLLRDGEWRFQITIAGTAPRDWRDDEIELMRELTTRIWTQLERARAEAALRESEAKYRNLFDSIDEGFCVIERMEGEPIDFRFNVANPAFAVQTGISDIVGRTIREAFPDTAEDGCEIYENVLKTGEPIRFEIDVPSIDSPAETLRERVLEIYAFRIEGEAHLAVIFKDITDRKRAEAQLRHAAEMDAFRVKLSDALRSLCDPFELQAVAARLLGEHLSANQVHYGETIGDYVVIQQGYGNGLPPMVGSFRCIDFGERLIADYRAGQTVVSPDVLNDPNITEAERRVITGAGFQAYIAVPLTKAEGWVATLAVQSIAPRDWTTHEVELVQETAERTWATIERARAEAALHESEIQRFREQSAREQERQRVEALAELDRAKTLFFSNVSHEFRTPLTLILAPLQDALSDRTHPLDPIHRERLELVHRNSSRLLKLVNTLLDFSRIEAGRMEALYEATDLALFTTELASVFRSAIERAGLRLVVDCPPLAEPVYVDREMWEKIVLNLLSNAFKFTLEGEIAVRLHLADRDASERSSGADRVMLQIQDTGTGIGPEELPHVFERFYQVRRKKARTHEGSGIGLALVHELIRLHGGTVDVSSTLGQGSCFTITIPLGTAHLPSDRLRLDVGDRITATRSLASTAIGAAPYVEEAERWLPPENAAFRPPSPPILGGTGVQNPPILEETGVQSPPILEGTEVQSPPSLGDLGGEKDLYVHDSPASSVSPARVLLVDDNADMREYLTRILSEHVQVEAVADGAAALAAAQERVPDLVLTDVMMPGLDGFELLKALRANPRTREVPIILLSACAGEESVVEGLEAGADDYLIKPFSAQELISRVNGHLQMAQLRLEALYQERTINRRKDELLSTVSHELNTPLVAILGWTRLLRANPSNQSMLMKSLETIERNATLQAKLIQDLLDISRISAGKLRLSLEPVELESVIETAIASLSYLAQAKGIDLVWWGVTGQKSTTLAQGNVERVLVQGDRDRLQQIVYNLLTNAIKFTPDKGSINIELSVIERQNSSDASIAEISITDTGIGISAEFLPHVFERFRQAQESSSSKGLGLGLAIARHLVELHNGTIRAESAGVGQGATFVVRLPLLKEF